MGGCETIQNVIVYKRTGGNIAWTAGRDEWLHDVVAGITREGSTWRANIDARELSGHAQYVQPGRQQAGRLFARLARLNLPPSAVSEVESMMEAPPTSMPALDIQIEDLVLRGKALGKVEIEATNQDARAPRSGAREWQLQKFNVIAPEAALRASGRWVAAVSNRPRRTEMNFRLDVQDAGALLTRLGTPGALRAGAGHLEGQIGWNGSPLALHYPSMQGQFQVKMGRGQFLKADPGVAKLLGVLSLQGLPRRLLLDFRDVFYEGFAFDTVQGDVQIQQGIASTKNLQIDGVNAVVRMEGSADIAHETQQLRVLILPQLNAGGASVVAGLAINPVVGLTAYLAQWLLTTPLSKIIKAKVPDVKKVAILARNDLLPLADSWVRGTKGLSYSWTRGSRTHCFATSCSTAAWPFHFAPAQRLGTAVGAHGHN